MIFNVKLSQQSDEIKGRIQLSGDPAFNLECACSVVQSIAETHGVSLKQVFEDLWRVAFLKRHKYRDRTRNGS